MPHFANIKSPQFDNLEANLDSLINEILKVLTASDARGSKETQVLVETLLQAVQPELPPCGSHQFSHLSEHSPHLLQFFNLISKTLEQTREHIEALTAGLGEDMMDIDDFAPQKSQSTAEGPITDIPRRDVALDTSPISFAIEVTERLTLIAAVSDSSQSLGSVLSIFIDKILSKPIETLISCRKLLLEIFGSDLILGDADAARLVERLGTCLESAKWSRCETFHGLCLDVLFGLRELWTSQANGSLADDSVQLFTWFIQVAVDQKVGSPKVQRGIAKLLLSLMKIDIDNSALSSTRSARTSLLLVLEHGNISTKFYIGYRLPGIFEFFMLKDHEHIFLDILHNLPTSADWFEGIALRLFVLAQLASNWATLLRRCIYHIFETPAEVPDSVQHATRCMNDVSTALDVEGPRELFVLFAPQLLYTRLEYEDIKGIPYGIFGFTNLKELVVESQHVAAGLMVMRMQEAGIESLAGILELTENEVLQRSFTSIMAYSIAYGISTGKQVTSEAWLKGRLGHELFFECVNLHFADTIALLFNTIDHGEMEKYLLRKEEWAYAGNIMKEIKSMNSSDVDLPPNQQPMFKARNLMLWITYLCDRTQYEVSNLYTPALVASIARTLLDTIHPALGSLHACSVIRKIRVLISFSGESALQGYPLEMLLHSISAFITDTECADDCFGMLQYLLTRGTKYLLQTPSFFAGIALSIMGSLGTFMQQRQASTTQDTQHKETVSKAKRFHTWMKKYVSSYNSPALKSQSGALFPAIVQASDAIGIAGNADIGTPESDLLCRLLEDGQRGENLLNQPAREIALSMLCSDFQCPQSFRTDIFGSDELAIANAAVVWKSCRGVSTSRQYLAWAGRVLGRAFAASGHIHKELLQESSLSQIMQLSTSPDEDGSRACILRILQSLTLGQDRQTVGLAEAALRVIVTNDDLSLTETCERTLSKSLYEASVWAPYQIPPSHTKIGKNDNETNSDAFTADAILRPSWLRDLAILLATYVPYDPVLKAMGPMLHGVSGFAARAFPFILHLVISTRSQEQYILRKKVSEAFDVWFKNSEGVDKNNLKMIINSILYLRTQPLADERSSADRSHWLHVDYIKAAEAATHCGMFKTALLFIEELYSGPSQAKFSRRSSTLNHEAVEIPTEVLLTIFQNIDDPDSYYGVQQSASLSTILARLEYEKDGPQSLAFRGAQYDSHIKRKDPKSGQDVQSLIKALDVLNLSGLSHSLMQSQQAFGMSTTSLESMFNTGRKLEQWDIPVPTTSTENSVTIYKAFQAIHNASTNKFVLHSINEGFECTMSSLVNDDLSASALHSSLRTLAAFTEMDEILSTRGSVQFEDMLSRFRRRSDWMETGR
jgi:ataxia telangiectasia mutated family protein